MHIQAIEKFQQTTSLFFFSTVIESEYVSAFTYTLTSTLTNGFQYLDLNHESNLEAKIDPEAPPSAQPRTFAEVRNHEASVRTPEAAQYPDQACIIALSSWLSFIHVITLLMNTTPTFLQIVGPCFWNLQSRYPLVDPQMQPSRIQLLSSCTILRPDTRV